MLWGRRGRPGRDAHRGGGTRARPHPVTHDRLGGAGGPGPAGRRRQRGGPAGAAPGCRPPPPPGAGPEMRACTSDLPPPSPMIGSAVLAAQALLASGDNAACRRLLPPIADGTAIAALAWTGPDGHWDPGEVACHAAAGTAATATPGGWEHSGWVLNGAAHHVLDGAAADVLLVAARMPDGVGLFDVDPRHSGVTRSAVTTMDGTRELAVVELKDVPGRRIGERAALAHVRDLACIALSAEQVGAAQRALELTVAYTQIRVQFGRAIGSFQALQHRMADLHVLVESARSLSYAAATAAAEGAPDLGLRAAAAKVYCSEAALRVAGEMIQLHGAIGITWEHEAHRYLKRAHGAAQLLGQPSEHVARIAAALIDRH